MHVTCILAALSSLLSLSLSNISFPLNSALPWKTHYPYFLLVTCLIIFLVWHILFLSQTPSFRSHGSTQEPRSSADFLEASLSLDFNQLACLSLIPVASSMGPEPSRET